MEPSPGDGGRKVERRKGGPGGRTYPGVRRRCVGGLPEIIGKDGDGLAVFRREESPAAAEGAPVRVAVLAAEKRRWKGRLY